MDLYSLDLDMHKSAVFPPQKRGKSSAPALCHMIYTKMSNLLWPCIHAGGGFIHGVPFSCKVAVGTGDITIGKYHYWSTVLEAASHMHPLTFMSQAEEAVFNAIGIPIKICPQELTPNWLAACCCLFTASTLVFYGADWKSACTVDPGGLLEVSASGAIQIDASRLPWR